MPTLLDLFSGCGGLTLGSHNAGYTTALAVDVDPILSSSFGLNFPSTPFLNADVTSLKQPILKSLLPDSVDGVVGGPPCQGFSGMGKSLPDDPRRTLLGEFFRIVSIVKPAFFVMENVPGLMFPNNKHVLDAAILSLGSRWEIVGPIILDASDFGAPTKRRRVFVFGFDKRKMRVPTLKDVIACDATSVSVHDAIGDLKTTFRNSDDIDRWHYGPSSSISEYASKLRTPSGVFTGNQLTEHRPETITRFASVPQGGVDPVGKYKRLSWDGLCPTLRAGTGSDKGSYQAVRPLHPVENRVITPREAARLQGFPDSFVFHSTVWHSCRMIGNSVSPIIAEKLLSNIRNFL
ncbi:DNA cytosine methyltransferase [Pseudomonas sp. H11T01]|uniref:DNA cytosine methyltransferase n=1 Tax=Pseudomonas sp. H11T01 TaxID=3402749 RepID=UPI003ACC82C9